MSNTAIDSKFTRLKIDSTDVFLENFELGRGKITISNTYHGSFSAFWGSMGKTIEEFIIGLEFGYFHSNVNGLDRGVFDGKLSVRNIRRTIREDYSYELPWYNHLSAQKELRENLKDLENCESEYEFIDRCNDFAGNMLLLDLDSYDEKEFRTNVSYVFEEPWNYIEKGPSMETMYLKKLFPKLQKELKKQIKKNQKT